LTRIRESSTSVDIVNSFDKTLLKIGVDGTLANGLGVPFGGLSHIVFPFAYDTPGLNSGVTAYTPAVGEILYNAWIEIVTAFNGTTPKADIAQTANATNNGVFWNASGSVVLSLTPVATLLPKVFSGAISTLLSGSGTSGGAPAYFTTAAPLKVWASQDGKLNGLAVGGSAGSAKLHLQTII